MNEQRTFAARLRTVVIVTLITVMVWLLAESRMVRSRSIEAQIVLTRVESAGGVSLVVRQATTQPQMRTATISIEGSTAGLDRFARLLSNRIELRVGREIPPRPGMYTIDLRAVLRQSPDLMVHGLTITQVSPETLVIEVDEMQTREFPIRVVLPDGVLTDGAPRVEPPLVRVQAPRSVLEHVTAVDSSVELQAREVSQLAPGRLETIPGAVVEIEGLDRTDWATRIDPPQVDVLLTLKTVTLSYVLGRLPVQVLLAPGEIGDWEVKVSEADKDLVGVEVTGGAEAIAQLRSGAVVPKAFVALTFEDLERAVRSKPAQIIGLPPGCRVASPEFTIDLEISRTARPQPPQTQPLQTQPLQDQAVPPGPGASP